MLTEHVASWQSKVATDTPLEGRGLALHMRNNRCEVWALTGAGRVWRCSCAKSGWAAMRIIPGGHVHGAAHAHGELAILELRDVVRGLVGMWDMALLGARRRSMRAAGLLMPFALHAALYKQRIICGRTRCCCKQAVQVRWHEISGAA